MSPHHNLTLAELSPARVSSGGGGGEHGSGVGAWEWEWAGAWEWELGGSMGMGVGWVHGTGETAWEWGGRMGMVVGAWWAWEHGVYSLVSRPLSRSRGEKSGEGLSKFFSRDV